VDDLDYFPVGWPAGYATRPGYANQGGGRPGARSADGEQADGVWQRLAAASGQPPRAPVDGQQDGYWAPQREAPGTGQRYAGTWSSAGYPPDAHYPPGAYDPAWADGREYPAYDGRPRYDDQGYNDQGYNDQGEGGPIYYGDPAGSQLSYDHVVDLGLPFQDDGPADAFARQRTRPNGGRQPRRRALADTGTSLLAGYPPEAAPARAPRSTQRPTARGPANPARPAAAAPGRPLPDWLPFGNRLVLLPKEGADANEAREHRDVSGGALRPAVFGAMDGLVTNASLIAGIGGGGGGHGMIVLTGVAGLIAGAFSMATGEYISVKSQNELTQSEVDLERRQHARDGAGKLDKLTQVFIGKGVSPNLAEAVARQISADPERAVAEHVREELGLDPDDLPSPRTAAAASMVSFTVGALIPLAPFLLGFPVLQAALALAGLSAYAGGAAVARLTGRPALLGGLRQFSAAFVATGLAFLIGHLVGAHV